MKKNLIISNLFNNLKLPKEMINPWELQYKILAEKCNADFENFKISNHNKISKHYLHIIKKYWPVRQNEKKLNQLSLLDKLDECFAKGYEWVFAMDADIVINPNSNFDIEKCNKNVVYFMTISKDLPGRLKFCSNLKNNFLKKHSLKYGNQGVLLISNIVWNSIKDVLVDFEKITKCSKSNSIEGFFSHIDQNILSIALTLKNIDNLPIELEVDTIEKIPNKDNSFLHFVGPNTQRYKDAYNINNSDFNCLKEKFVNSVDTEISNRHLKWFPLLFHYLNLTTNEKQKLFEQK